MPSDDLFSALSKYDGSHSAENYLTEAFAYLLRYLLKQEAPFGTYLVNGLCGVQDEFLPGDADKVTIATQTIIANGVLDITISAPGKVVYLEAKDYSLPVAEKLRRYRKDLDGREEGFKRLVLVTRFATDLTLGEEGPHHLVRWSQIHDWITTALEKAPPQRAAACYLAEQFVHFLEAKEMSEERVSWELAPGVVALTSFAAMLDSAITGAGLKHKKVKVPSSTATYYGWTIEPPKYWCGLLYQTPSVLVFQLLDGCPKAIKEHLRRSGQLVPTSDYDGFCLDLEDENVAFFALGKERQLKTLTDFIKGCYDRVKQAEQAVREAEAEA